jgi:ABC-type phosphate transport system auxiliary subunit
MYESLSELLRSTAAGNPWIWAMVVMAVVAITGLLLYLFWEGILRLVLPKTPPKDRQKTPRG